MPNEAHAQVFGCQRCHFVGEPDSVSNHVRIGPSDFFVTWTLKSWSIVEVTEKSCVPILLINGMINGKHDEAQDEIIKPIF